VKRAAVAASRGDDLHNCPFPALEEPLNVPVGCAVARLDDLGPTPVDQIALARLRAEIAARLVARSPTRRRSSK